jgi:hypothetical protein
VDHYCVATCSDGVDIKWTVHNTVACRRRRYNKALRCPARPPVIPVPDFGLRAWSAVPMQCVRPPGGMPPVSLLVLAFQETEALNASLRSYEEAGFLQVWVGHHGCARHGVCVAVCVCEPLCVSCVCVSLTCVPVGVGMLRVRVQVGTGSRVRGESGCAWVTAIALAPTRWNTIIPRAGVARE